MNNEEKILQALEKLQTQMDGMQTQMDGMQTQMDGMQTQMDTRFAKVESQMDGMRTDISDLKSDVSSIRVLVDIDIEKKLNILAEGHQTLLETLAPKDRVDALEEEVSTLKSVVRLLADRVNALGNAG
ncbi:MAG: hypothetical protein J6C43_02965 [Oscillospiraceae bacterium]|nr:hypothetical protein [Oscillospiraceae bacterium]